MDNGMNFAADGSCFINDILKCSLAGTTPDGRTMIIKIVDTSEDSSYKIRLQCVPENETFENILSTCMNSISDAVNNMREIGTNQCYLYYKSALRD